MRLIDYKIGTRLALAFALVVVVSVASAGLALSKLAAVEAELDDVVNDNNVKIQLANELAVATHVASLTVNTIVILEERSAMEQERVKVTKARADYAKAWEALKKMPDSAEGKALQDKIEQAQMVAAPLNEKVLDMALANRPTDAAQVLIKQANPATAKWQQAIDENSKLQERNTKTQYAGAVSNYEQARTLLIGANLLCVGLGVLFAWIVTRSVTAPMNAAKDAATRVADGDLTVELHVEGKDETAQLVGALLSMKNNLTRIVDGVRRGADGVAAASAQIAHGNQDLSQRTEEQASALEETAASMEQLSSTVKQNADNARQANQLAMGASTVAIKGGEVVGQVVQTMKGINDSSRKIADIISVIDGIAFQTNILALNAAVEAARAGEQGRGFAVVASEVRGLAGRSADAAKEIKSLINASVERVEQGTALVDQAGATMTEVVSSIKRVTDIMGEISAASTEQSAGVAQVGEAVSQMDRATQQNAALVEQSAAAAESLKDQAQALVQAVAVFKLGAGEAVQNAATALVPSPSAVERRGPDRARNVTRPRFGARAKSGQAAQVPTPNTEPAPSRTGTDGEWTSF
jgi:methyl-accepting chemotaxis protein